MHNRKNRTPLPQDISSFLYENEYAKDIHTTACRIYSTLCEALSRRPPQKDQMDFLLLGPEKIFGVDSSIEFYTRDKTMKVVIFCNDVKKEQDYTRYSFVACFEKGKGLVGKAEEVYFLMNGSIKRLDENEKEPTEIQAKWINGRKAVIKRKMERSIKKEIEKYSEEKEPTNEDLRDIEAEMPNL